MEAMILDKNFEAISLLDTFESFIWTDRYIGYGDFELYMLADSDLFNILKEDNYVITKDTTSTMIIETVNLEYGEEGSHIKVIGRSLESLLERRIIWNKTTFEGKIQNGIKKLLDENAISPSNTKRKIPNLVFVESTDPYILNTDIEYSYYGENVYDAINEICGEHEIGFSIILTEEGYLEFRLYRGEDRTYNQTKNNYVIFSPRFDNLFSSNYVRSNKTLKNAILISGEVESVERTVEVELDDASGINRREIFGEANSMSSISEEEITEDQYLALLRSEGKKELAENKIVTAFEGEIDSTRQFIYGVDFFIGDIVQVVNEYDIESTCRISEIVRSSDENGDIITPTFTFTDSEEEDV